MKRVILYPYNNASRPTDLADGEVIPFASWQMNKASLTEYVTIVKKKGHKTKCTSL
jgi:hypothetical protein